MLKVDPPPHASTPPPRRRLTTIKDPHPPMQTTAKITLAIGDVVVVSRRRQRVGIPRREIRSISQGVQLILFPFIGVSKSLKPFKNLKGYSFFFLLQNVLSPEGRYAVSH